MRKTGVIVVLALIICGFPLRAEEIQTKDGNKITGKIVSVTDDAFQIKTAYGDIKVPRSEIVSISFPENQPPSKADAPAEPKATPVDESLQGTTYINRTAKFQLEVPRGWIISEDLRNQSKDIIAALTSPDKTLLFMVTPERFDGPISTYRILAESQYQTRFKDYEKLEESEVQVDGKTAVRLIWHTGLPLFEKTAASYRSIKP
jgi:hypothetical protein